MTKSCRTCSEIKPRFFRNTFDDQRKLVKATAAFERLSIDFKGPVPTNNNNKFILTVIDEFSRFPFAFPCSDVSSKTVIKHLNNLFMIFGMPSYVHSDRGTAFLSAEVQEFLHVRGNATSRTTAYNPQGNGQVEKLNSTLWRTILLALKTKNLSVENWEQVLSQALHSIRSLLCTTINCTPHERMFRHP
ncbi:transposase family protein, partial [Pseudomonas aeruginosa]